MEKLLSVEEVRPYCRIDYEDDDDLLEEMIIFTENYLRNAIDGFDLKLENDKFRNLVKLTMKKLIKHEYDNRDPMENRIGEKVSFYMQSTIQQLKHGDYYEI